MIKEQVEEPINVPRKTSKATWWWTIGIIVFLILVGLTNSGSNNSDQTQTNNIQPPIINNLVTIPTTSQNNNPRPKKVTVQNNPTLTITSTKNTIAPLPTGCTSTSIYNASTGQPCYKDLPADFSKNPPFYIGTKVKIDGAVIDFFAKGDRGGAYNYIEITPITNQIDSLPKMMLEINSSDNYQSAVSVLNKLSAVTAYGTIESSTPFTMVNGGTEDIPTIKVVRLDSCNSQIACTGVAQTIFQ
jgi:hypothetical protein